MDGWKDGYNPKIVIMGLDPTFCQDVRFFLFV